MSVLIKNFEMPKSCAECQFSDVFAYPPDYDDEWICGLEYFSMNWEDAQMRHSNCPLVEIPPHGRLIDADAFMQFVHDKWEDYDHWLLDYIEARPTIIEAEEET